MSADSGLLQDPASTQVTSPGPADDRSRDRRGTPSFRPAFGSVERRRALGGLSLLLVVGAVAIVPVAFVIATSFGYGSAGRQTVWSLEAWIRVFENPRTLGAIGYTFLLSVRVPIGILLAFGLAWMLVRVQIPAHRFISHALWFAFFLPVLPVTLGWILLLDPNYGLINETLARLPFVERGLFNIYSIPGIIWVHLTLSTIPIMTILLSPALAQVDASYEEAAEVSGSSALHRMRRITLPLIAPAALTAFLAGLIRSLEVFEVEQLLGLRAGVFVYSTRIYNLLRDTPPDYPQAMALSTFFLFLLLCVALLYQRVLNRYKGNATVTGKSVRSPTPSREPWAYVASGLLLLGLAVSIGLPFLVLLLGSFNKIFGFFFITDPWTTSAWQAVLASPSFSRALRNSLFLGLTTGFLGTTLCFGLAWALARTRFYGRSIVSLFVWMPWAVPGILLGIAFLNIFTATPLLRAAFGTMIPFVVVIIVQMLPLGTHMIQSAIEQVSGELEEAGRISGAGSWRIITRISLPLVSPMCLSVFVLTFMAAVRDISTTVLLVTPGTRTLSLLMFEFATGARMESAAVIGVIIAGLALLVTTIAMRLGLKLRM